ncbi:hypothetical protein D3874_06970 [Oleomonas cavernae]|uniref:Tyr recombinase domain-containing protein n=1 Tax=Oleomonas cavernae TaxID=2320859 RepID=A0A418W9U9_9PROT|nr:tyrosine-type recombinase/integrase [Oleomonas cavernae]RJF86792.1 hypothetical protein D3874_06970 [Oleomonas cavernae]
MAVEIIQAQLADVKALAARKGREDGPWVFPAPGGESAMARHGATVAIWRAAVTSGKVTTVLGIPHWTAHDLRRTAATLMEEAGISPFVIGHVLNHVSATKATITSRVYARYTYDREKREALDLWAERLAGIIAGAGEVVPIGRGTAA